MSLYRVNLDGSANLTFYTQDVQFSADGHLRFYDEDGRERMFSRSHRWTVTEISEPPAHVEVTEPDA